MAQRANFLKQDPITKWSAAFRISESPSPFRSLTSLDTQCSCLHRNFPSSGSRGNLQWSPKVSSHYPTWSQHMVSNSLTTPFFVYNPFCLMYWNWQRSLRGTVFVLKEFPVYLEIKNVRVLTDKLYDKNQIRGQELTWESKTTCDHNIK